MAPTRPILFLDHATVLGGAENSLLGLMEQLRLSDFWQPHLAAPAGALTDAASALEIPVHEVSMPRLRRSLAFPHHWQKSARQIAHIVHDIQAELVHSNTVRATIYGALAARLAHRPFVWHMRDFWLGEAEPGHPWLDGGGKRLLCAASTRVIANSAATASHLPCSHKVEIAPNGIRLEFYDPAQADGAGFRQMWRIPPEAPLIGMVGRLRPWKGQETFLQMAALVHRRYPDARFVIVGGHPFGGSEEYVQTLHDLTRQEGLAEVVIFAGHQDDVRPALAAMDVFVHPGSPEPFGLVNIEAMAMQKPVVAFAHGALPEIVTPETGILVPSGDIAALAEAVMALLAEPQRAAAMGRQARARVAQNFTIQQTARKIEEIYRSII